MKLCTARKNPKLDDDLEVFSAAPLTNQRQSNRKLHPSLSKVILNILDIITTSELSESQGVHCIVSEDYKGLPIFWKLISCLWSAQIDSIESYKADYYYGGFQSLYDHSNSILSEESNLLLPPDVIFRKMIFVRLQVPFGYFCAIFLDEYVYCIAKRLHKRSKVDKNTNLQKLKETHLFNVSTSDPECSVWAGFLHNILPGINLGGSS